MAAHREGQEGALGCPKEEQETQSLGVNSPVCSCLGTRDGVDREQCVLMLVGEGRW